MTSADNATAASEVSQQVAAEQAKTTPEKPVAAPEPTNNDNVEPAKPDDASDNVAVMEEKSGEDVTVSETKEDQPETEKKDESKTEDNDKSDNQEVKEDKDPAIEATMHFIQGKRHILVQDFYSAVDSLQKACELLSAKYGDDAPECAEALMYYGKALLELHRRESGALNDMDQQAAEESDSDEEEEEEEEAEEEKDDEDDSSEESKKKSEQTPADEEDLEKPDPALKDPKLDEKEGDAAKPEEKVGEEPQEKMETDSEKNKDESSAAGGSSGASGENKETGNSGDEEGDVSNLQIAFEVLDLAKKIYKRGAEQNAELYLKAADCLLHLGEVGLESDNYEQAIEDFEECLRIQQEMLAQDDRALAETNYQLGLTYSFVNKYDKSAAFFTDAMDILLLKVSNLKKFCEVEKAKNENRGSLDDDPVWKAEREIEDIEQLLPEIKSKIDDNTEMMREKAEGAKDKIISEMMDRTPEASPVKKPDAKVNVISSSLIKRKRPLEGEEAGPDCSKKTKS